MIPMKRTVKIPMKVKNTLTKQQMLDMLNGNSVGFFTYMILNSDNFYNILNDLCLGYYMSRSGEKSISPFYERLIDISNSETVNKSSEEILGIYLRAKFIDKWNRIYDILSAKYDALSNTEITEAKTGKNQNKDTHDTAKTRQGTNSDVITYDTNVSDNGKVSTDETTTRTAENSDDIYGFNSDVPVGDTRSAETTTERVVGEDTKNTTSNTQIKTGTENKQIGINENETNTGTDTTDIIIDEKVVKTGRYGIGAELITQELTLRNKNIFFDIIYSDIDSIITIPIYNKED